MNKLHYGGIIMVAFVGGLIGGLFSTKYLSGEFALASGEGIEFRQRQIYAGKVIAEELFLHERKETVTLDGEIPIPRAILTTQPDGNPKLIMQDKDGKPRLSIGLSDSDGATVTIMNAKGNQRAVLTENSPLGQGQSGPSMAILDDNGEIRAQLGVRTDGNPFFSLKDPSKNGGKPGRSILLSLDGKDKAKISLCGPEAGQRAELFINSEDTRLALNDIKGQIRAELGNTDLAFGKDRSLKKFLGGAFAVEKRTVSSLVLYDESGKVLWTAP